tara:strand:- start:590 stop:745 length:156 start_codon:yes stop_codon:yes gene_type:complete
VDILSELGRLVYGNHLGFERKIFMLISEYDSRIKEDYYHIPLLDFEGIPVA